MRHPIPRPRRCDDTRPAPLLPLPRRRPLIGPACEHPSCRARRAQRLPRLGGHRTEFAPEHARAAAIQTRCPGLIVYYGEATGSFWAITPTGLLEALDTDALLLALWRYTGVSEQIPAPVLT